MHKSLAALQQFYLRACELDVLAFKPGNVSIYADGHGMQVEDFKISATVSSAVLCNPDYALGERIYQAVKATRDAVGCNTNLGIVLLCAPLLEAAWCCSPQKDLRQALAQVLAGTTVIDATWVFRAIALANPGGLGTAEAYDVAMEPDINLLQAMQLAQDRDRIALQYYTCFKDIFDFGVIRYNNKLGQWGMDDWAAVAVYTGLLSQYPDSHIERKYGCQHTIWVKSRMAELDKALMQTANPQVLENMIYAIDREFKQKDINPGSTADLTVATLLAVLILNWLAAN